jgi:membrane fusion protein (multidrug efflux system)
VQRIAIGLVVLVLLAAGAYLKFGGNQPAPSALVQRPPAPEVGIIVARPAEVALPVEYAGRIVPFRDVEVRPRVSGLLLKREYEEGAKVEQDQVLFRIDPAAYQVALSRAEAQLSQAGATVRQAEENFKRIEELSRRQVATGRQLDEAIAQRDQARASVKLAEAEINGAKLNLSYTTIKAPVAGVTALDSPSVGTLIQTQQTLLTTITPLDPAYVSFSFTDEEGQAFRALNAQRARPITEKDLTVRLKYGNERVYPHPGKIDISGQKVDPQTGTIQARAIFPNPEGALLPGQFVRIQIDGITLPSAIVIPKQAVGQGPQGPFVYIVADDNDADVRPIRLGQELANSWVVADGLKGGERVIVDGVVRVRAGAPVKAVPFAPAEDAQSTAPSAGQPTGARP